MRGSVPDEYQKESELRQITLDRLKKKGCLPFVPPALGCDIEHQTLLKGIPDSDGQASRMVLEEIEGFSESSFGGWWGNYATSRDWGRKYNASGCYYVDCMKLETATPLTLSARDQVCRILAMRRVVDSARARAEQRTGKKIFVLATCNDRQESTELRKDSNYWGFHANVCMPANAFRTLFSETNGRKTHLLYRFWLPAIASAQVICGAGCAREDGFILSDRILGSGSIIGNRTTDPSRPLICQRDEPHADPLIFSRLMTIHLDNNMSEIAMWLKLGNLQVDTLILEAAAFGLFRVPDLTLCDPLEAIATVAYDPRSRLRLESGKPAYGISLQKQLWEVRNDFIRFYEQRFGSFREVVPDYPEVMKKTEDVLNRIDHSQDLIPWLDWAKKKWLFENYLRNGKGGWKAEIENLKIMDMQYHNLNPEESLFHQIFVKQAMTESVVPEHQIRRAMNEGCPETRSWFRGEVLKRFGGQIEEIAWDSLRKRFDTKVTGGWFPSFHCREMCIPMPDPMGYRREEVAAKLKEVETVEELFETFGVPGSQRYSDTSPAMSDTWHYSERR